MNRVYKFEDNLSPETIWFFGRGYNSSLYRTVPNLYTLYGRNGKHILLDKAISQDFPGYCYVQMQECVEKDNCYIVTKAKLLQPEVVDLSSINKDLIISERCRFDGYNIEHKIMYSILGGIPFIVTKYNLKGRCDGPKCFDCYISIDGRIINVEEPYHLPFKNTNKGIDWILHFFADQRPEKTYDDMTDNELRTLYKNIESTIETTYSDMLLGEFEKTSIYAKFMSLDNYMYSRGVEKEVI